MKYFIWSHDYGNIYSNVGRIEDYYSVKLDDAYVFFHDIISPTREIEVVSDTITNLKDVTIGFEYGNQFNILEIVDVPVCSISHVTFREYREHYLDVYVLSNNGKEYLKWKLKNF